jgi:hypothetical protein
MYSYDDELDAAQRQAMQDAMDESCSTSVMGPPSSEPPESGVYSKPDSGVFPKEVPEVEPRSAPEICRSLSQRGRRRLDPGNE